jgi:hypothetical protein
MTMKQYVQYVRNTGQRPLPTAAFDEDWEPAGPMIRRQMLEAGLIEEWGGALMLTDKGDLWERALRAIASGETDDPRSVAAAALKTQTIEFARWCA